MAEIDPFTGEDISNLPRITVTPNPLPVQYEEGGQYNTDPMGVPYPTNPQPDYTGINPIVGRLFGVNQERYQLWPERMVRSGATLAGDVASGQVPIESTMGLPGTIPAGSNDVAMEPNALGKFLGIGPFTVPGPNSEIARAQDTAGLAGLGGIGAVGVAGGVARDALGVVPVGKAKQLKINSTEPSDLLKSAVENTPSASIDPDGALRINVKRGQHPDQEMSESVRGGVFYLPAGDKRAFNYSGKNNYGGSQKIEGETAYLNPLVVKGATGGKAPENAFIKLKGNDAFKELNSDVMEIVNASNWMKRKDPAAFDDLTHRFFEKYVPELSNHIDYILKNSSKGNQLRYALQEAAIASAVRNAGHDGIIGYSVGRGENQGKPFISEIFDVRENRYPSPTGDYSIHPQFLEDSEVGTAIAATKQQRGPYLRPALKYKDKIYKGKEGEEHPVPEHLRADFEQKALSGEDLNDYNFGFVNHKGQFLTREKALDYAIKEGLVPPETARYGTLTTTMLEDSKAGTGIDALQQALHERAQIQLDKLNLPVNQREAKFNELINQGRNELGLTAVIRDPQRNVNIEGSSHTDAFNKYIDKYPNQTSDYLAKLKKGFIDEDGKFITPEKAEKRIALFREDSRAGAALGAVNQSGFYSNLERAIANSKLDKGTPEQWQSYLKNQPGIKGEELEHSLNGLPQKQLTKDEVAQHVQDNGIKVGEVWKGNNLIDYNNPRGMSTNGPKYQSYTMPGGENYRELLLTLPEKKLSVEEAAKRYYKAFAQKGGEPSWEDLNPAVREQMIRNVENSPYTRSDPNQIYQSSHWEEPNVLAHIRMNDRVIGGKEISKITPEIEDISKRVGGDNRSTDPNYWDKYKILDAELSGRITKEEGEKLRQWQKENPFNKPKTENVGGLKTLHVEEIQSDWHQAGRKYGYKTGDFKELQKRYDEIGEEINGYHNYKQNIEPLEKAVKSMDDYINGNFDVEGKLFKDETPEKQASLIRIRNSWEQRAKEHAKSYDYPYPKRTEQEMQREQHQLIQKMDAQNNAIPNAPFKTQWSDLALKRVLREAVDNGYDAISWTPGSKQAERYDLSKQIDQIHFTKTDKGYLLAPVSKSTGHEVPVNDGQPIAKEKLADYIGKEIAEKIIKKADENPNETHTLENVDLRIGGEGMKGFYDKMLVDKANSLVKKMGGKVEYKEIPSSSGILPEGGRVNSDRYHLLSEEQRKQLKRDPDIKVPFIRITPEMKKKIKEEGFPLFTAPQLIPVDKNPFEEQKKQPRLVPVPGNPFTRPYIPGEVI